MIKPWMRTITTPRLVLRPLIEADLPMTLAWRNRDDVRMWFGHSEIVGEAEHYGWFRGYCERDNDFFFMACEASGGRPVGQISIFRIDRADASGEMGRILVANPEDRKRGLAREACNAILALAGEIGLREVHLEVLKQNTAAIRLYERCGLKPCGERDTLLLMSAVMKDGK